MLDEIIVLGNQLFPKMNEWGFTRERLATNINLQCDGWGLLHLISYEFSALVSSPIKVARAVYSLGLFSSAVTISTPEEAHKESETVKDNLIRLATLLINLGADVNLKDSHNRTPICFVSASDIADLFVEKGALDVNFDEGITPLHVVCSQMMFSIEPLMNHGLNIYNQDKYQRLPIHCAVALRSPLTLHNIKYYLLWDIFSQNNSMSTADNFGHYPLSYALVYGDEETIDLCLENTPIDVIHRIHKTLDTLPIEGETTAFTQQVKLDDLVYSVPPRFQIMYGAGRNRRPSKREITTKVEAKIDSAYEYEGNIYNLLPDEHGKKHTRGSNTITKRVLDNWGKREATFNNVYATNYNEKLAEIIKCWCRNQPKSNFIEMGETVGWDEGEETTIVELYYNHTGSHMRPKYCGKFSKKQNDLIIDFSNSGPVFSPS